MMQNFSAFAPRPAVLAKWLALCLLALSLAACSLARVGYDHGDTLLYWWLNGYAGFHGEQKPWVRQRIAGFMAWHRSTQLEDYVLLLRTAQTRLQGPVTAHSVLADYDELGKRADRVTEQVLPDLADFALMADAANLERLEKKFAANNREFREDYLDGDVSEQQENRYRKIMEQAEYWFGDFSDEQEERIRHASDQRPLNNQWWLDDRIRRQQVLLALLRRIQHDKPPRASVIGMLRDYMNENSLVSSTAPPEMRAFALASKQGVAQIVALIVNIATPEQKAHAHAKLQKWIGDFDALTVKG
ncbi:MAG: hypothetical protein JO269_05710 [Burkholderiaceae bacterium]|nr:hypothetical protein [Burkholderiaceae bacterium]